MIEWTQPRKSTPVHFILVHSPSVGPSTWEPVRKVLRDRGHVADLPSLVDAAVLGPPSGPRFAKRIADSVEVGGDEPIVLVTHSNAGFFAPAIGHELVEAEVLNVFVDASVPPSKGSTVIVPKEFLAELQATAVNGILPRWTDWWDEADVAPMFPNAQMRLVIEAEQPRLPLSYYEQIVDVPNGWDTHPCGYVLFGPPYDEVANAARQRGWPVRRVDGQHLHMVVDPVGVADAIEDVIAEMCSP